MDDKPKTNLEKNIERLEFLKKHLKVGDTITHTRCMGCIEEHIFTGYSFGDHPWLCGKPTKDTTRIDGLSFPVDDISPCNVTHVNRVPVDALPYLVKKEDRRKA